MRVRPGLFGRTRHHLVQHHDGLFAIYIDPIFNVVNWALGGGVWDPSVRYISKLPAELRLDDE